MPANGYLLVRVYTSAAQLPVEDAAVTVTQRAESGSRLLASRITDDSGQIEPVAIPAPDRSMSLSPENPAPFTEVDVTVDHPGYERILAENVQIFADVRTIQNFELIPFAERPQAWNLTEVFDISAQPL